MTRIVIRGGVALVAITLAACRTEEPPTAPIGVAISPGPLASVVTSCTYPSPVLITGFTAAWGPCGRTITVGVGSGWLPSDLTKIQAGINGAVTRWGVFASGSGIPGFVTTSSPTPDLAVSFNAGPSGSLLCADGTPNGVIVYRHTVPAGTAHACATSLDDQNGLVGLLVHELGHAFGRNSSWHDPTKFASDSSIMGHCAVSITSGQAGPTGYPCQHDIEATYALYGMRPVPQFGRHIITRLTGLPPTLRVATGSATSLAISNGVLEGANGSLCGESVFTFCDPVTVSTPTLAWSASPTAIGSISGSGSTVTFNASASPSAGRIRITPSSGTYEFAAYLGGDSAVVSVAAPATIVVNSGNSQTATVGSAVAIAPSVLVKDASNQPLQSATVSFAASGNGSVVPLMVKTNAAGIATVTSWTLSTTAGGNTLTATVAGLSPLTLSATGTAGPASQATVHAGNNQSAPAGAPVAVAPAIRVTDPYGNGVAGRGVTFAIASGGGSVTGASQTTNASGIATVGSWTLGTTVGTKTLSATVSGSGVSPNPVMFTATATTPPIGTPSNFHEVSRSCFVQGGKTYVNYTVNWTRGEFSSGSGYQILESTSPDTLLAAVIKAGPSGTTTTVLGAYTVNATPNNRYWWIRHTLSGGATGPLAAFNSNPKNVAEGCIQ